MSKFDANFRVVLRPAQSKPEASLFSNLGEKVAESGDAPLYQLTCTEVKFSSPAYLEVQVFKEPGDWLLPLFIPHHLVLAISGSAKSLPAGFAPWNT